jgi:hypothetical protein
LIIPTRLDMSTIDMRREQMFPKLEPREIDRLRRYATVRRYAASEALFVTGEVAPGRQRDRRCGSTADPPPKSYAP